MRKLFAATFVILFLSAIDLSAQEYAISLKASTIGMHLELFRSLNSSFNVHVGGSFFKYNYKTTPGAKDDYSLDAHLTLNNFTALVDWMPFESYSFRVSGGICYNNNNPDVLAVPAVNKVIGGDVYNKDNLGNMGVNLTFNSLNPYLGVGMGNPLSEGRKIGYTFDLGFYYQGAPGVGLKAEGLLAPSASPAQEAIVEHNLKWFKFYPVLSFGITYKL